MTRTNRADGLPPITVVGVGGGGCNAVNRMITDEIRGVDFVAVNTDNQQLEQSLAPTVIRIADSESGGLGVGGDPERGARAAENARDEIGQSFNDVDMVFITAGMGGGTGTGAAPVVAELAKAAGALTIAVVTRPFEFEGMPRARAAQQGIEYLETVADTVIVIPNQSLIDPSDRNITVTQAFHKADEVLRQGVKGISEVLTVPGEINLDFNDVKKVMDGGGHALMALGRGSGENRVIDAAEEAVRSPLLETSIDGSTRVLYNITSAGDLGMLELQHVANFIRERVHPEAEIIMGTVIDPDLDGDVQITVIATGFADRQPQGQPAAPQYQQHFQQPQPQHQYGSGYAAPASAPAMPDHAELAERLLGSVDISNQSDLSTPAFLRRREPARNGGASSGNGYSRWDAGQQDRR